MDGPEKNLIMNRLVAVGQLRSSTRPRAHLIEAAVNCKVDHVDGPEKNAIMVVPRLARSGYNHHIAEKSISPSTIRMRMRRVS